MKRLIMLTIGVIMATAAPAAATDASLTVAAPASAVVGSTVEVQAVLKAGGEPVAGAELALQYTATFAGESGFVELDRAVTDESGTATFGYTQRATDNGDMRVLFVGGDDLTVQPAVFSIEVMEGSQQFRSRAGVSIPFLSGTAVIGVVMLVWLVIVFAAWQLVRVSRAATGERRPLLVNALAIAAVITATGMVVVYARTPLTHANLDAPEGYDRTPVAHLGESFTYRGIGLADPGLADDGRALYLTNGCANCHGIDAGGGIVGPDLNDVESVEEFIREVRRGPEGMPAFPEGALTDGQLQKIYEWLSGPRP